MTHRASVTSLVAAALALVGGAAACRAQRPAEAPLNMGAMDSTDQHTTQAAHEAMSGPLVLDRHVTLSPLRPANAADSARAARFVVQMRAALARYRDVGAARADGFRQFLPGVAQPVYHFTNWRWALEEMFRFNPAKPTSLLYRRDPDGRFLPRVFGWMVHVMAFASDDPNVIWGGEHQTHS